MRPLIGGMMQVGRQLPQAVALGSIEMGMEFAWGSGEKNGKALPFGQFLFPVPGDRLAGGGDGIPAAHVAANPAARPTRPQFAPVSASHNDTRAENKVGQRL